VNVKQHGAIRETKRILSSHFRELAHGIKIVSFRDSVGYSLFFGSFIGMKDFLSDFRKQSKCMI
jgi:hypothetical protein